MRAQYLLRFKVQNDTTHLSYYKINFFYIKIKQTKHIIFFFLRKKGGTMNLPLIFFFIIIFILSIHLSFIGGFFFISLYTLI